MTAVLLVVDDYRAAGAIWDEGCGATTGPRATWIEQALATHLAAHVTTTRWQADPRQPSALTLAVTGATREAVAEAAELYLSSAGITYQLRGAA